MTYRELAGDDLTKAGIGIKSWALVMVRERKEEDSPGRLRDES